MIGGADPPVRVGFVLHVMHVAGAEMLVAETIRRLGPRIEPVVFCLDAIGALGERLAARGRAGDRRSAGGPASISACRGAWRRKSARAALEVLHAHQYTPFFYGAHRRPAVRRPAARHLHRARPSLSRRRLGEAPAGQSSGLRSPGRSRQRRVRIQRAEPEREGRLRGRSRFEVIETASICRSTPSCRRASRCARRSGSIPSRRYVTTVARFHPGEGPSHAAAARSPRSRALARRGSAARRRRRASGRPRAADRRARARRRACGSWAFADDVADLLRASDVFALTSVSEAASITLLEAMACALAGRRDRRGRQPGNRPRRRGRPARAARRRHGDRRGAPADAGRRRAGADDGTVGCRARPSAVPARPTRSSGTTSSTRRRKPPPRGLRSDAHHAAADLRPHHHRRRDRSTRAQSPFYALLFYLWNAYFRPEEWTYGALIYSLNLSFIDRRLPRHADSRFDARAPSSTAGPA